MKTVPIYGTQASVSFYEDDTIETVRQLVALEVESHPDRLFLEVNTTLPADYYSSNPKHWMELFFRLSYDGRSISEEAMDTYVNRTRLGTGFKARTISKEEWERRTDLDVLLNAKAEFSELRVFGVPAAQSMVLPIPPRDVPLPAAQIPIPRPQSLVETFHPYPITELHITSLAEDMSDQVKRTFFPLARADTPSTVESLRTSLAKSQADLASLLALPASDHESSTIVKAKWYIPLVSTRFTAPRTRFEQIFYGMTVSETTPHIAYFTAKTEITRHKFFTENPKTKSPQLATSLVKGWLVKTLPNRRRPTLLLYRGKSAVHFERIAITDIDITVDVRREKSSKKSLDALKTEMETWIQSLDALTPFVDASDLALSRWELVDLTLVATYAKEVMEFDMRRFACLQSVFGVQNNVFRLLRAEQGTSDIPPPVLQAYQVLNQEGATPTPEYLADELSISVEDARERMDLIERLQDEVNFDQALRAYPTLKFTGKEVILQFVTNADRTLKYADILRYVLTTDSDSVNTVCPRRLEEVAPAMVIPQQEIRDEDVDVDLEFLALLQEGEEEPPVDEEPASNAAPPPKARKIRVSKKASSTQTYFNERLKKSFPDTFDQSFYPKKCEKKQQVVVLSADDQARIPSDYNYSEAPESERLDLETGDGVAICPPFWCIRDELPLREDKLKTGEDGGLQCPVCSGKVRTSDTDDLTQFTVIRRDSAMKYPDFLKKESTINKKKVPCCYLQPRSQTGVIVKDEELYILREDVNLETGIPALRFAYLSETLANRLRVKTHYETTVKKNYLIFGESDVFRIGLGRPAKTLPILFDDSTTVIRSPAEAPDNVMKCSFFRTWTETEDGAGTQTERIIASINTAYKENRLTKLQELEYVTTFLQCEVILVDIQSFQVTCGFWSDTVGANSRTIAVIGNDILGLVRRKRVGKTYKTEFTVNLRKPPFGTTTWTVLADLHKQACSVGVPTFDDAVAELQRMGKSSYQRVLDPFGRTQALLVSGDVLLPILPSSKVTGAQTRDGYSNVDPAEFPEIATEKALLESCKHPGYKFVRNHRNMAGEIVELEVAAGFRIPVRPSPSTEPVVPPSELVETVREAKESTLVNGVPNEEDKALADSISYSSEIYEFLMYSLSKDIQSDSSGDPLTPTLQDLRTQIAARSPGLYQALKTWVDANAYEDTAKNPVAFVNKVRTPCGQYTKDDCKKSTLCGMKGKVCKIKVNPIVKKEDILKRMVKTLRDNDKQRALVLDGRLSPFFSTVLYLEMPHEVILTSL